MGTYLVLLDIQPCLVSPLGPHAPGCLWRLEGPWVLVYLVPLGVPLAPQ